MAELNRAEAGGRATDGWRRHDRPHRGAAIPAGRLLASAADRRVGRAGRRPHRGQRLWRGASGRAFSRARPTTTSWSAPRAASTQLVLAVVFRLESATPNICYTLPDAQEDPRVDVAVPVASVTLIRASVTSQRHGVFRGISVAAQRFALAAGRFFATIRPDAPSYEAVLGAEAAQKTGLRIGDRFYEGEEMAEYPLTRRRHPATNRAPTTARSSCRCPPTGR